MLTFKNVRLIKLDHLSRRLNSLNSVSLTSVNKCKVWTRYPTLSTVIQACAHRCYSSQPTSKLSLKPSSDPTLPQSEYEESRDSHTTLNTLNTVEDIFWNPATSRVSRSFAAVDFAMIVAADKSKSAEQWVRSLFGVLEFHSIS